MLILKHLGPGPHPNGSPQSAHGGENVGLVGAIRQIIAPHSYLAELRVVERKPVVDYATGKPSANAPEWVRLEDGSVAVDKWVGLSTEAINEVLAYKLGKLLGVQVPETVQVAGEEKHVRQRWAEGELGLDVLLRMGGTPDLVQRVGDQFFHQEVAALDFVMNQRDRHDSNYLARKDSSIVPIDNGNTLEPGATLWWDLRSTSPFLGEVVTRGAEISDDLKVGLRRVMYDKQFPIQVRAKADFLIRYGFPLAHEMNGGQKWQAIVADWMRTMQKHLPGQHSQLTHDPTKTPGAAAVPQRVRQQVEAIIGVGGGGEGPPAAIRKPKVRRKKKSTPPRAEPSVAPKAKPQRDTRSSLADAKVVKRKSIAEIKGQEPTKRDLDWVMLDDGRAAIEKGLPIDEATNEILAYEVGKILGVQVPETVITERHKGGGFALVRQLWADGNVALEEPLLRRDKALRNPPAAALDFVTNQFDRHVNNWMIDKAGQPILIDNGNTVYPELMNEFIVRSDSDFISYVSDKPVPVSLFPALDEIIKTKKFPAALRARAAFLRRYGWYDHSNQHKNLWDRIAHEFGG